MYLTNEEEHALNGEYGEGLATAYRILVAIGEATNADKLIEVEWAHISGVNYNTIGDAGLSFLEEMSKREVKIKTTINPMGFDPTKEIDYEFKEKQMRIINAYKRMNANLTLTCIPYEVIELPKSKYVSLAESNAAVYANSLLDLRTNKESALSALASAFTGKAPYSLLRREELRKPEISIINRTELRSELDYGLLGYFAGKMAKNSVSIPNLALDEIWNAKAISAGLGTSGSCGMFSIKEGGEKREKIEYDREERSNIMEELSDNDDGDIVVFGSPQLGVRDLARLADKVKDKRFKKRCIAFCARKAYEDAYKHGIINRLERAGIELYTDCCACLTPLIDRNDEIITNSIKGAYYLKTWNKAKICLKSMDEIVKSETHDY